MDSLQDTALSSDNWLLNYVEMAKTIRPPLDSRVRTHMWVFHHFFSEFAKSNWEVTKKEREPQQDSNRQDCHTNRPDGGKLGRTVAQRIAREIAKIRNSLGRSLREDEKRENVSGKYARIAADFCLPLICLSISPCVPSYILMPYSCDPVND